jgi:hypothetical protein
MIGDTELAHGTALSERTIVGAFPEPESAREAAKVLHAEGFHKTWIGVTRADFDIDEHNSRGIVTTKIESADTSVGAKIGRFFSGEPDGESLYDALLRHGVSAEDARSIDASLEPNDILLTVKGSNQPDFAAQIIEDCDGDVLAGGFAAGDRLAVEQSIEASDLTQLRNERLGRAGAPPVITEDIFIVSSLGDVDDGSRIAAGGLPGTRSMGAAAGTLRNPGAVR